MREKNGLQNVSCRERDCTPCELPLPVRTSYSSSYKKLIFLAFWLHFSWVRTNVDVPMFDFRSSTRRLGVKIRKAIFPGVSNFL